MEIFYPELFKDIDELEVLFTDSSRGDLNRDSRIPGLNLGYNTEVPETEIDRNFEHFFELTGWNSERIAIANQVHHTHIESVVIGGVYDDTDGFVTTTPGLALGIRVADCAAILAGDPVHGVAGAFHAGWKGAAAGILPKGIAQMKANGADAAQIRVYISPCISLENFEVGEEVAEKFPDTFVDRESYTKPHVDLKGYLLWQLTGEGVKPENIEISNECTVANERFYSYRRERNGAGRMLGAIKLNR